ncbi:Gamma-glutamyl phosphate reductase [Kingella potus]|uniref:Gamma-glutamyl phosphate reductase n=1 Tax=Kingella potus TaxID=265175 RepID=A0A377QZL2_9NEIS|nr:glutamate-5-semialdehyde dehydrogenase [Kingella potus]STR00215.1 Gamma-glutamyl phosphate reductase [Kingella potus]
MNTGNSTLALLEQANRAKKTINTADTAAKNRALAAMADALEAAQEDILAANRADMADAAGILSEAMLDRLLLDGARIKAMADGIRALIPLPDPVGTVLETRTLPNGLVIRKIRVALGVIGIIYESRPNVTSDAAALALKSGSAVVLRSGREAWRTAAAVVAALKSALDGSGISPDCIGLVSDTGRDSAHTMMKAAGLLDLLIPRGGAGLIRAVVENACVPVIETGTGICHIYVDKDADLAMALDIADNAKTSRPSVCNAAEVCLVHRDIAAAFLPMLRRRLVEERQARGLVPVELRLDTGAAALIGGTPAQPEDFDTEFADYILAVKTVGSADEAIAHIDTHGTRHSDAIVTANPDTARRFAEQTDSAAVYINASTRFTDGGQFGLGCEMGIATQKLHARGPMGLAEMTTYKYVVEGEGQVR